MRIVLGVLALLLALALGAAAYSLFSGSIRPWLQSPDTTHITWIFAGLPFTGWQLFVPFGLLAALAAAGVISGVWILLRG